MKNAEKQKAEKTWRMTIPTQLAIFTAVLTRQGVKKISYRPVADPVPRRRMPGGRLPLAIRNNAAKLDAWLRAYASGKKCEYRVPLDLSGQSNFRVRVWRHLRRIAFGKTIAYGQLAQKVGCRSARAIGAACGANPLPILIPCHRVVAQRGLGGWSGLHGWKEILLRHEYLRVATRKNLTEKRKTH